MNQKSERHWLIVASLVLAVFGLLDTARMAIGGRSLIARSSLSMSAAHRIASGIR